MIRAEGLSKQFVRNKMGNKKKRQTKEEFFAVDHVSLQVNAGEIVGILGPARNPSARSPITAAPWASNT